MPTYACLYFSKPTLSLPSNYLVISGLKIGLIPGMAESTVAAVQAALNKKQVELYEVQVSNDPFPSYIRHGDIELPGTPEFNIS
jgi:hypothetical protein